MFEFIASLSILSIRILKGRFVTCVKWINILMHDYYTIFLKDFLYNSFSAKHTGETSVWFSRIYVGPYHCQHSSNHLLHTRDIWNISDESTICSSGELLECQICCVHVSANTFCNWSNKNSVMNIFSKIPFDLPLRRCSIYTCS